MSSLRYYFESLRYYSNYIISSLRYYFESLRYYSNYIISSYSYYFNYAFMTRPYSNLGLANFNDVSAIERGP